METLKKLRDGRHHHVLTAVILAYPDKNTKEEVYKSFVESTTVTFGNVDDDTIQAYVETGDPMDKAGSCEFTT